MSTPTSTILDAIATAMAAINGAAPYTVTVKAVNEIAVNRLNDSSANAPAVTIIERSIEHTDAEDVAEEWLRLTVELVGSVALTSKQKPHKATLPLFEDVRTAVKANRTWGSVAKDTEFKETRFYEGEAQAEFALTIIVTYKDSRT